MKTSNKKSTKPVTLDTLAQEMRQGFANVEKRFEGVDRQFAGVDKQFAGVDAQFARVDTQFESMATMIAKGFESTATKQDVARVEERLGVVETKLDRALYTEMTHLEARVKRLEQRAGIKR